MESEGQRMMLLSTFQRGSSSISNHAASDMAARVSTILHFASPILLLTGFLIAFTVHSIHSASKNAPVVVPHKLTGPGGKPLPPSIRRSSQKNSQDFGFTPLQYAAFCWLSVGIILTFIGDAIAHVAHALWEKPWWCGQAVVIYVVASVFVYALILISMIDSRPAPTVAHLATWTLGLCIELVLFTSLVVNYTNPHRERSIAPAYGDIRTSASGWEIIEITLALARIAFLVIIIGLYLLFSAVSNAKKTKKQRDNGAPTERSGLLDSAAAESANGTPSSESPPDYGAAASVSDQAQPLKDQPAGWSRPVVAPQKSWWEYLKGYSLFFPYLWPAKSRRLQLVVIVCLLLVILQRGINVLVPLQVGLVTNILSGENGADPSIPWGQICLYILYRFLQGGSGVLGAARSILWIPISQYSYQALSTSAFEHVHSLSLDFHLGKKTGEVLSALSKGSSINTFLEQVTFQVLPMLVDLGVAFAYFLIAFDAYYALVVAIVTFCYLYLTVRLAQWRTDIRRQMTNASREEDAVKNDSMVSYETVKYFNAEDYEFQRYRGAVQTYQRAEYYVLTSLTLMNVCQNVVFTLGLLVTCFIAAYQVTTGQRKVGQFVTLLTYMAQLQGPLNFFGTFYRSIQSSMINSERLLELFKEQPTVVDDPDAKALLTCDGDIRFQNLRFSYDSRKPALQGLSFTCAPGTTTALVGESGGGKSTVFRLLFRFYNALEGTIQVDGIDVRDVTIDSLRKHIGVVPQDTVLFNETLMYNLKYANTDATDEEVHEACRAASIHDKIEGFPDGYNTKVGERGLRLSGGEKQRVAIARAILKDPKIILLDEATAALDSETEQHIQSALQTLSKGRTMLVIAHRLSTITTADQILCLHAGKVVESGTHEELLRLKGRYANMWKKQIRAEQAAEEARVLKDRADTLRNASVAGLGSGDTSDDNDGQQLQQQKEPR